ncbi:hypothetical protein MCETE7_00860 [Acidimicrobiia bacterium]
MMTGRMLTEQDQPFEDGVASDIAELNGVGR